MEIDFKMSRRHKLSFFIILTLTVRISYQQKCNDGKYLDQRFDICKSCQDACIPTDDGELREVSSECKTNCPEYAARNTKCQEDFAYVIKQETCIDCRDICKDGSLSTLCEDKCQNFKVGGCRYNSYYDIARELCIPCEKYCTSEKKCEEGCEEYLLCHHPNPCKNGGHCIERFKEKSYTCNCANGWEGKHCEQDILECASNPCNHGGECIEKINGFKCDCSYFYSGDSCEDLNVLPVVLIVLALLVIIFVIGIIFCYKQKLLCFKPRMQEDANGIELVERAHMLGGEPNGIIPDNPPDAPDSIQPAVAGNGGDAEGQANGGRMLYSRNEPGTASGNADVHHPASFGGSDLNQLDQGGAKGSNPEMHPVSGGTARPHGEEGEGVGVEESRPQPDQTELKEFFVS